MFKKYKKIINEEDRYYSKQNGGDNGIYKTFNVEKNTKYRVILKKFRGNIGKPKIWIADANNKQIFIKNLDNPYFFNKYNQILNIGLIFVNTRFNYSFSIGDIDILKLNNKITAKNKKIGKKNGKKNVKKNGKIRKMGKKRKKIKRKKKKKINKKRKTKGIKKKKKGKIKKKKIKKKKINRSGKIKTKNIQRDELNDSKNNNVGRILSKYFDHIYVINLDKDIQRLKRIEQIFEKLGIQFERFSAIYGKNKVNDYKKLFKKPWNSWEKKMNRAAKIKRPTVYGCLLSHREIVKNAIKKGYKRILIFEDDIIANKSIKKLLIKNRRLLRNKWKLIYLGSTQHDWTNIEFLKNYYYANETDGCFAYGMDKSIYRKFLKLTEKPKYPVDYYMRYFQERYHCPVLYPQAFIAKLDQSRLRRKRNIKRYSRQFRWNLRNFNV